MNAIARAPSRPAPTHVIQRPVHRVVVDLLGPSIGSIVFLAFAVLLAQGSLGPGGIVYLLPGVAVFGFFGVFMGLGFLATIRRGVSRRMLEIGPAGLWTPEMGFLAWREIAEVRLEQVRGPSGDTLADYPRIGIVPIDPARTGRVHRSIVYRMSAAYSTFVRLVAPRSGWQDPDSLAPFGVYAYELDRSIGAVVDAIREFHEVRMPDGSVAPRASELG